MKRLAPLFLCLFIGMSFAVHAQQNADSGRKTPDSMPHVIKKKPVVRIEKPDSANQSAARVLKNDTLHSPDTSIVQNQQRVLLTDSIRPADSAQLAVHISPPRPESFVTNKLLSRNKFINVTSPPVFLLEQPHKHKGKEFLFYTLCVVLLLLGMFRTFYAAYFKNLFRVYFNTSLRQTQLVDQLRQAKLPSFIMNIFFLITAGIYIWMLFNYFHPPRFVNSKLLLPFCILSMGALYFVKFCLLKFMGWVSDIPETTNHYIFAIFLVNKVMGVVLVPVIILLAFLDPVWVKDVINISYMLLALVFISRYVKSYGVIERKIPLNAFHFLLFIAGAEIIPLLILYKVAVDYLV